MGTELALELARWEVEWVPEPEPTEEDKAVEALHLVLCWQFTEHDPKLGYPVPTRLCQFNIALFDFEKECECAYSQPFHCSFALNLCCSTLIICSYGWAWSTALHPRSI